MYKLVKRRHLSLREVAAMLLSAVHLYTSKERIRPKRGPVSSKTASRGHMREVIVEVADLGRTFLCRTRDGNEVGHNNNRVGAPFLRLWLLFTGFGPHQILNRTNLLSLESS